MQRLPILAVLALALLLPSPARATEILIATNSTWRFMRGTNSPSSPDTTAWRRDGFDDTQWILRPAPFHYGEAAFQGTGTLLADMSTSYNTFHLRRSFVLTNAAEVGALTLRAICDDGFLAWINGTAVVSQNAPAGTLTTNSVALTNVAEPLRFADYPLPPPSGYLQSGTNVLAIQVFNVSRGSSDAVFDGAVLLDPISPDPLTVTNVSPTPGLVYSLTSIRVVFSEPVLGVRATDLLLNGTSATNVTGSGTTYTFTFAKPPYGTVTVGWDPANAITTAVLPVERLLPSTPGSIWAYEFLDPDPPQLISRRPLSDSIVRVAAQAEVLFDKVVTGVDASDLLINGLPATNVTGFGAGPYVFEFPAAPPGQVQFSFTSGHGIQSDAIEPQPFGGAAWSCQIDPAFLPGTIVINELQSENLSGILDEETDHESWIELRNIGGQAASLAGWSLTDDPDNPGQWVFPDLTVPPGAYVIVFTSGKDRRVAGSPLHTNFKLSSTGEYLGLYSPDGPRQVVDELRPEFPEIGPDHAYGRAPGGGWAFFARATPGAANTEIPITTRVDAVHFSVSRGFYNAPVTLSLHTTTSGALIRYTLDGSVPAETNGLAYTAPILVSQSRVIRAAAFKKNHLPSRVQTHTYLYNLPVSRRGLPALSIVTATNNLYGRSGIMESGPSSGNKWFNTTKHGIAWERPASVELIRPEDNGGFVVNCGLRVAGGDYIRPQYNYRSSSPPQGKYSFRLYFRGDYGPGRLDYPWFPRTRLESFNRVTLRAGMNDPTNPFILDEVVRSLAADVGQVASHGTFVNLFLNGVYKGYYNPAEHIDESFLADYYRVSDNWDLVDQSVGNVGQTGVAREGDTVAWNQFRLFVQNTADFTNTANYLQLSRHVDLTNFVDYLLPLIYVDADDWPHNNWRAGRERTPNGRWRFYAWDAEWSFGFSSGHPVSYNTINSQLSTLSPPWGCTHIQTIFNKLKRVPEFKLLFADRIHQHFFNGGALTDERIRARYDDIRSTMISTISSFNNSVGTSWIPNRRRYLLQHFSTAGLLGSSNAPVFSQFGGPVSAGFLLTMTCTNGTIYYTTDETDPRSMFSGAVAPGAFPYTQPVRLDQSVRVSARTLYGTNWSALTQAAFLVELAGPLRITELMYNPPGGDAYEYIELQNLASYSTNLQNYTFQGINFQFPIGGRLLGPGARIVLASDADPAAFATRYPGVAVAGWFGGSLDNGGETIALLDPDGNIVCSVTYGDELPWPPEPDGTGPALEITDPLGDPDDPANWHSSLQTGGSPGQPNSVADLPLVRLNEALYPDWLELANTGTGPVNLDGWSVVDSDAGRRFSFPANTSIPAGGFLVVWCDAATNAPGLHTGFALDDDGPTVALLDATGRRIDALTFGPQVPDLSVGRVDRSAAWVLTEPTPGAPNEPATTATAGSLALNEIMANPPPGNDDWLEIHNRDPEHAADLRGFQVTVSNRLALISSLTFVPPAGFVVLKADENPGPDHLTLRLPAAGGQIRLLDRTGIPVDSLAYNRQVEGVSLGRYPDGSASLLAFPDSATPGASNRLASWTGPVLSEFMARNNATSAPTGAPLADWIELHNASATPFGLGGMALQIGTSDDPWRFPAGVTIPGQGFLLVWCDPALPPSTNATFPLHIGRGLPGEGSRIQLLDTTGQPVDGVNYGFQLPGLSVGRFAAAWGLLETPTPGSLNSTFAPLGDPLDLRLNEWMADNGEDDDWLEVYNPQTLPVDMAGMRLTDDLSLAGQSNTIVRPLTFVPPQGFAVWIADDEPDAGPDHLPFSLNAYGEALRLYASTGAAVDTVFFEAQQWGASEGRWPDGSSNRVRFVTSPSPGESNYLPLRTVVLNELLTHTDPPLEDAIELRNLTAVPIDVSGWFLSDRPDQLRLVRLPSGTIIPANGYRVIYENQFNPAPDGGASIELDSAHGETLYLSEANGADQLTGFRDVARFAAAPNGLPWGRVETSAGPDLSPLVARTFGQDTPSTLEEFRTGQGLVNAAPQVGPIVFSEILYHPVDGPPTELMEHPDWEFVELHNTAATAVPLFDPPHATNTWRLDGGVEFTFPTNLTMPAGATWLVVRFNPTTHPELLAAFRAHYGVPANTTIQGPFAGRLNNAGETLLLQQPDTPQGPGPDAGFVPRLQVDRVVYRSQGAWPTDANGSGKSIHRRSLLLYGNEPLHWIAAQPTPGAVDSPAPEADSDGDGMPNGWESDHGLAGLNPNDASSDTDQDGFTALEEYVLGTDPRDPSSGLTLTLLTTSDEFLLQFTAQSGRSYTLEFTDDPASGSWFKLADVPAEPSARQLEVALARAGQPSPRFFRLVSPGRF